MKRALAIAVASGLLAFGVAPAAQAGEITGNQNPTPIKIGNPVKDGPVAASECSFSGLDDFEEAPDTPWDTRPRVTQSFGQIARYAKHLPFNASMGCNPVKAQP